MIKELSLKFRSLQGRRVACDACRGRFTCLVEGTGKVSTAGILLVSGDEGMQRALGKKALARLRAQDRRTLGETGLCPHCRRYPRWMVRRSRKRALLRWGAVPFLVLFLPFGLPILLLGESAALVVSLVVGVAGAAIGWTRTLPEGVRKGKVDPAAITDDEVRSLLDHALAVEGDPLVEWYLSIHDALPQGDTCEVAGDVEQLIDCVRDPRQRPRPRLRGSERPWRLYSHPRGGQTALDEDPGCGRPESTLNATPTGGS